MKKSFLFTLTYLILLSGICLAQKKQNIYFLKNDGTAVKSKENADFTRVIQEPDSGSTFFNLYEFYKDGSRKRVGKVSSYDPRLIYEESLISYYPNGKKKELVTYARGKLTGFRYNYYPNGKLQKSIFYEKPKVKSDSTIAKLVSFYDSTGVELVKNGTGYYKDSESSESSAEEGYYADSVKHGVWKGVRGNSSYEESYEHGKFISGIAHNAGIAYPYTKVDMLPEFKGGINNFLKYFGSNYKYPPEAQNMRVQGKIIVSFVVEKDGSLNDFVIVKDIGYDCGKRAVEIIKKSPKWIPGRQHGIPVRVAYTLPVVLSMR